MAIFFAWQFTAAGLTGALEVPPLQGRVNDLAGILSTTDTAHLEQQLSAIEAETTNQIAILIIPSLDGTSIEDFSIRVARTWALGQKGRNNGVLILMAVQEREVRIEVGYGLEGALTDAQSSYIIRNIMIPEFRQQHNANGLSRAVDAIAAASAGEFRPEPKAPVSD
ncbi:MAG: TPM domain-containing protein, partial [Nitrospiria bacterium]